MKARHWRFLLPVLAQVVLLAAIPARGLYTRETGTTVMLKLAPVDPYDMLSGHHMTLGYEISRPLGVEDLADGAVVYVSLAESDDGIWRATGISDENPGVIAIRGRCQRRRLVFGIESYYFAEAEREGIQAQVDEHMADALAEVKVDSHGGASLIGLHIGD